MAFPRWSTLTAALRRTVSRGAIVGATLRDVVGGGAVYPTLPAMPVPDVIISTRAELVAAIAGATTGVNRNIGINGALLPVVNGYPQLDTGMTDGTNASPDMRVYTGGKTITLFPLAGYGPCAANPFGDLQNYNSMFVRTVSIRGLLRANGGGSLTLLGLRQCPMVFPAYNAKWETIGLGGDNASIGLVEFDNASALIAIGCEPCVGKDGMGTPFSRTEKLADFNSPTQWWFRAGYDGIQNTATGAAAGPYPGWGDAVWPTHNRHMHMPVGFKNAQGGYRGNVTITDCHIHDVSVGIGLDAAGVNGDNQQFKIQRNRIERCYLDAMNCGQVLDDKIGLWLSECNVISTPIGNQLDAEQPHTDGIQGFSRGGAITDGKFRGIRIRNNVIYVEADCRGLGMQLLFLEGATNAFNDGNLVYLLGPEIVDNLAINGMKGFYTHAAVSPLLARNVFMTQDGVAGIGGAASVQLQRGNGNPISSPYLAPNSKAFQIGNLAEVDTSVVPIPVLAEGGNLTLGGQGGRAVPLSSVFADPNRVILTPNDAFQAFKSKSGSAYANDGLLAATLKDHLTIIQPQLTRVAWPDALEQLVGATVTSARAMVFGPEGIALNVTPQAGVSWASYNAQSGAVIRAMATGNGTVLPGQMLALQGQSAATSATPVVRSVTLGSYNATFRIQTASATVLALAQASAQNIFRATNGLAGIADGKKISLAGVLETPATYPGVNSHLVIENTGANVQIYIGSAGQLGILIRNGGNQVSVTALAGFAASSLIRLALSIDQNFATLSDGFKLYVNDVRVTSFVGGATWNNGLGNMIFTGQQWGILNRPAGGNPFTGKLGFLALYPDRAFDFNDPAILGRTTKDYIGPAGEGIDGVAATVFLSGVASELNGANTANRAPGINTMDNTGTDMTQAVAGNWPPNLSLIAEQLVAGAVRAMVIGYPKTGVTVTATGTVSGAHGPSALPVARDGLITFTGFSAGETVTITNSGNYINPAPFVAI